jgi:hypothetical protein
VQHVPYISVSRLVPCQLWFPKLALRSRLPVLAASVLMPKASMYKDYHLPGAKNKVRIARQVPRVETVAVAHAVNQTANNHLRLRVSIADSGHTLASFRFCQWIVAHHRLAFSPAQQVIL